MQLKKEDKDQRDIYNVFFHCKPTLCRNCKLKKQCMRNPASADTRKGNGRQVSFILKSKRESTHTD